MSMFHPQYPGKRNWFVRSEFCRVVQKPAVISALASGLLYLSHPTLAARVRAWGCCHNRKSWSFRAAPIFFLVPDRSERDCPF